jgi:predicted nucleotidyltransferase
VGARHETISTLCREHSLLAVYLFGSRAADGLALLAGEAVPASGSDLDVGVVFAGPPPGARRLATLQVALEDVFAPMRLDLVPLQEVDAIFQAAAIDGHRIVAPDSTRADLWELVVMRRAAELLPIQRQIELETFGTSSR